MAARLAAAGHLLRIPTRRPQAAHAPLRVLPGARLIAADIHNDNMLAAVIQDCDAVVNLVGILNEPGRDGAGFARAHSALAQRLVTAMATAGISRLVQISALHASARNGPSHYLRSKGEAEDLIAGASGLHWSILQPSVIFGPDDSFLNRFAALLKLMPGIFPLARAGAQFAPVHVDDVALAVHRCLEDANTDKHRYQLCGPDAYTLRALVNMVARTTGHRRWVIGLPDWLGRFQARILERLPGQAFTMDNFRSLTVPSVCTQDGFGELGIQPRTLSVNLRDCLGIRSH